MPGLANNCLENRSTDHETIIEQTLKSMSMRGPGSGDTCHLTDFNETWPD